MLLTYAFIACVVGKGAGRAASGTESDSVAVPMSVPVAESCATRHWNCRLRCVEEVSNSLAASSMTSCSFALTVCTSSAFSRFSGSTPSERIRVSSRCAAAALSTLSCSGTIRRASAAASAFLVSDFVSPLVTSLIVPSPSFTSRNSRDCASSVRAGGYFCIAASVNASAQIFATLGMSFILARRTLTSLVTTSPACASSLGREVPGALGRTTGCCSPCRLKQVIANPLIGRELAEGEGKTRD
mmetsp:Transcript_35743/g.78013  ORF Transcript_35743/g.78013 Transcript_35743/m.78013 type:complete len:243 (-) Transcript_35743:154-882(-)